MMWYWSSGVHWWGWLLGGFGMIVFWGLVIWAIVALVGLARGSGPPRHDRDDDPERILARRLAEGEIDLDEYHRLLEALRSSRRQPF